MRDFGQLLENYASILATSKYRLQLLQQGKKLCWKSYKRPFPGLKAPIDFAAILQITDLQLSTDQKYRVFRYQIAYRKQSW